jgi:hypothetical protein
VEEEMELLLLYKKFLLKVIQLLIQISYLMVLLKFNLIMVLEFKKELQMLVLEEVEE